MAKDFEIFFDTIRKIVLDKVQQDNITIKELHRISSVNETSLRTYLKGKTQLKSYNMMAVLNALHLVNEVHDVLFKKGLYKEVSSEEAERLSKLDV